MLTQDRQNISFGVFKSHLSSILTRDRQNISFGDFKSHLCSILTRTGGGGASGILSGKPGWQRRDYY